MLNRIPASLLGMLALWPQGAAAGEKPDPAPAMAIHVTIDRGRDVGHSFGSLFEAISDDGSMVLGAGFQNGYNTRYRADRHALQFYIRPTDGKRTLARTTLPRPNRLCGTYLEACDGIVYSTYGGRKAWNAKASAWKPAPPIGGTEETMRVGNGLLEFGDGTVRFGGRTILPRAEQGNYEMFFYANGRLCFYHIHRGEGGYRPYRNDRDGFSKLCACPWTPGDAKVDFSKAIILTLPIVGETTFAWGQFGDQIVTGSNVGGFYIFEAGAWRTLRKPKLGVSYQLYSTLAFHDRLLMGQYPTGRIFQYDGKALSEIPGWPPKLQGVSGSSREAQTTAIYGGDLFVGVWPWGELWKYNPDSKAWNFASRLFDHPALSNTITHPYDVENKGGSVPNQWGQRVTSLVPNGADLIAATSAKSPCEWDAKEFPFLAPEKWKSYGTVHRLTMAGHLGARMKWTGGPTHLLITIRGAEVKIMQDNELLASATVKGPLAERLRRMSGLKKIDWGTGIYGRFKGKAIQGKVVSP